MSGRLTLASPHQLVVVVHGLGGSSQSVYAQHAARVVASAGMSCLRLNLRGADGRGEDLYHAGLSSDLAAVLQSPALLNFEQIYLLGYSLGGHVTLRYAAMRPDPRVKAVAAICSPLHLERASTAFDAARFSVYRSHVLGGLKRMYASFWHRRQPRDLPHPSHVERIAKIREWDERVVAPRHGYESAKAYYDDNSAALVLGQIGVRTLLLHSLRDPMVPITTIRPFTRALTRTEKSNPVDVREVSSGGHVGFPSNFSLNLPAPEGLEAQVLSWFSQRDAD